MKYNELSLRRHQNAGRKVAFSNGVYGSASFAPLWQTGALAGAGLGTIKGGLDQNEDGTQIDPASRLMNVGTNALAGATLLGAAGAGIPQLMQENPAARYAGQAVYDATGITPDSGQIPMRTADRIRYNREMKRRQGKTLEQRVAKAIDPITGRAEVFAEDIDNATRPVRNLVGKGIQAVQNTVAPTNPNVAMQQQAIKQAVDASIADETARLSQQAVRTHLQSPEVAQQIRDRATTNANKFVQQVVDTRTPLQKGVDAIGDAAKATPQVAQKVADTGRKALAMPFQAAQKLKSVLPFSYMGDVADFATPYTTGAMGGAVLGTGIGAGLGLANGMNNASAQEQAQLDQIQAIPDPYARKKEWDVYDADLARTGRNLGYGVQTGGNTLAGAGMGAAGGALLGGAALTGYMNLRNKKFNGFGQPTPSRIDGLKTFLTGKP